MLSNIALIILSIYAGLSPLIVLKAVSYGARLKSTNTVEQKIFNLPKRKPRLTEDMKRTNDILSNIEVYNGTSSGQKEIK